MRLRNIPYARKLMEDNPQFIVLADRAQTLKGEWSTLFEKTSPIHLEIGMGKGVFLYEMARTNPDINYLGIEIFDSVIVKALERLIKDPLPNLRLISTDARFLTELFLKDEIEHIYLNFSDPWPKDRHAKRRLTHERFLTQYREILPAAGEIRFKTDNRPLFEFSLISMNSFGLTFKELSLDLHAEEPEDNIRTEYETRWSAKGAKIYRVVATFNR